ncbi:hypothetical protein I7I50_00345 [Histoplasma capsulatum G186AR]|uniref:Uncharacterized protein n=1 Tax=Ajellomyces capsulatus TaxID=5037 RepID=A0A8H7YG03_AJECA|nr:hypothetical protein I7I52_07613 [Histoplasma capsulatum]QSS72484.1 hypothetical protein I7I50_00345 [Histoplasma capsulatum G186AR]
MHACTSVVIDILNNHDLEKYRAEIEFFTFKEWKAELGFDQMEAYHNHCAFDICENQIYRAQFIVVAVLEEVLIFLP